MSRSNDNLKSLNDKVREWLDTEGYPLEFRVAHAFRQHGFETSQGVYVRDPCNGVPREVDVTACLTDPSHEFLTRVYHVIECKWSQNKPWVVFTGGRGMASAACISQTISSDLGSAILWKEAGLKSLHNLDIFATPTRSGFNGRQAFSKGKDYFYDAMRSVVALSTLEVQSYDEGARPKGIMPRNAAVAFPVIVVDGKLFEAYFDSETQEVALNESDHIRCHWRGSSDWPLHATVDIITADYVEEFALQRHEDVKVLLSEMNRSREEINDCFRSKSLDSLKLTRGPRGMVGLHPLIGEVTGSPKTSTSAEKE